MAGYISNEEYKKAFEEKYRSQNEWRDAQRVKKYIHDYEIKEWKGTIASGLTEEQFTKMVNDIAIDREQKFLAQGYATINDLYKKLGELIEQGHGEATISVNDNCGGGYSLYKKDLENYKIINDDLEIGG